MVDMPSKQQTPVMADGDSVDNYDAAEPYFAEEAKGWHGYVEWAKYPEKAKKAAEILSTHDFAGVRSLLRTWRSDQPDHSGVTGARISIRTLAED